nr:angiopoietin-2-like isoform X2 [Bactrocera oleae]
MKLSQTVSNLVLHAILLILEYVETANVTNTSNISTDNRRALRDRLLSRKNASSVAKLNTQTINKESIISNTDSKKTDDILNNFVQKISTSKETISNLTKLIDNTTEVGNGNKKSSELKNGAVESSTYMEIDDSDINSNAEKTEEKTGIRKSKSDIESMADDPGIEKREIKDKNVNLKVDENGIEDKSNVSDKEKINRMGELRSKFTRRQLSGIPDIKNSSRITTIVIGANELGDFKRNFNNLLSGSLAGPVLTTVIKTKSVLKDNKWITATEKNFIYYRDQTKRPEISKTYNTTTYTNSQQFGSEGKEKTMNFETDAYNLNYAPAAHRSVDDSFLPSSCAEIMKQNIGATNGVHSIYVLGYGPTEVYCFADPVGSGCAWTVFMRRINTGDSFDKNFAEYKFGFGEPNESFFLGLDRIYAQTTETKQELGIFTKFETNDIEVEKYAYFVLGNEETGYRVEELGAFSRTSAISRLMRFSKFSTRDMGNGFQYDKCAQVLGMGWWYSERCKSAIKLSGVRAYVNAPTIMGLRPRNCQK